MESTLKELEAESLAIIRESMELFGQGVLLFSGGKDSTLLLHLARLAYAPDPAPLRLVHIDTGHNFPEVTLFTQRQAHEAHISLFNYLVEEDYTQEELSSYKSRNRLQSRTLQRAILELGAKIVIGGARRDEDTARAKERVYSLRANTGGWLPETQMPEPWDLAPLSLPENHHFRVFPLSNWTEKDVWSYICEKNLFLAPLYYSHLRRCRDEGSFFFPDENGALVSVRARTVGDATCTGFIRSTAKNNWEVYQEIAVCPLSERSLRQDDRANSLEIRKREGYF